MTTGNLKGGRDAPYMRFTNNVFLCKRHRTVTHGRWFSALREGWEKRRGEAGNSYYHRLCRNPIEVQFVWISSSRESVCLILFNLRLVSCSVTWWFCHLCVEKGPLPIEYVGCTIPSMCKDRGITKVSKSSALITEATDTSIPGAPKKMHSNAHFGHRCSSGSSP